MHRPVLSFFQPVRSWIWRVGRKWIFSPTPDRGGVQIRPFESRDMEAVVYVWRVASASAHPFLSRRFLAREARLVRTFYLKNTQTWVLETGGHVVGFVSLTENKVGGLFLDPRFHGRGFGKALMDKAVALRGAVSVEVFKKNVKGRRFYNRYGFVYEGEYYHTPSGQIMVQMFYEPEPEKAFSPYPASFSRAI